jgi:hypothetical protein
MSGTESFLQIPVAAVKKTTTSAGTACCRKLFLIQLKLSSLPAPEVILFSGTFSERTAKHPK